MQSVSKVKKIGRGGGLPSGQRMTLLFDDLGSHPADIETIF